MSGQFRRFSFNKMETREISHENNEILMLKESFRQLTKIQEECSRELSEFQRENFIAQEEFRAISSKLSQQIEDFQTKINQELDKISLKINRLEIIAMYAFNISNAKIITSKGAEMMACAPNFVCCGLSNGDIKVYRIPQNTLLTTITRSSYDPLETFGKISVIHAQENLFVGFNNGTILAFKFEKLDTPTEMKYHQHAITAFHQFDNYLASGCIEGVVVLWDAKSFERLVIVPMHRLPIISIIDDGTDWIVADKTGVITKHNQLFNQHSEKFTLSPSLVYLYSQGPDRYVTISDQKLLTWNGKRVAKTFNAVPIEKSPICCMKSPELIVLGSNQSNELRLIFLDTLIFPKTINCLDSPPLSIIHQNSIFYVLTKSGNIYALQPTV